MICGMLLIITGVVASLITGQPTAIIPAPFGLLIALGGFVAIKKPEFKKHAMHVNALLALIGILATLMGMVAGLQYLFGLEIERPVAAAVQSAMFILCFIYMYFSVRSFVRARSEVLR